MLARSRLLLVVSVALLAGCSGRGQDDAPPLADSDRPPPAPTTKSGPDPKGAGTTSGGSTGDDGSNPPPADDGTMSKSYVDYDINHVIVTGQSNSVANGGTPYLSKSQPFNNMMFDTGVMPMDGCDGDGCYGWQPPQSFMPLVEGDIFFEYAVETSGSGMANQISNLATTRFGMPKHDVLVSLNGRSGNTYWCLRKGSCAYHPSTMVAPFEQAMNDIRAAKSIADAQGATYAVRGVTSIHGESDHYAYGLGTQEFPLDGTDGTPGKIQDYADALVEWQADYEADATAITGQQVGVPLFISQLSGWNDVAYSKLAQMQLDAHVRAPGKVILVTPGYHLSIATDCLHFDAAGERRLGEYFAKAYSRTVFGGIAWEPLRPKTVTRAGNVLTVKFLVPKAPLVIDTDRVSDPGNYGFTIVDDAGAQIQKVELAGADSVTITLDRAPSNATLRYAQNQVPNTCIGPGTVFPGGARGNLRDSDETPSQSGGDALYDWSVAFAVAVP
jgi:hypothetical protein